MVGYFRIIDNKKKEIGKYKYVAITDGQKKLINALSNCTLSCCCNDEEIEVKINEKNKFVDASDITKDLHEKGCPMKFFKGKEEMWTKQITESSIYYNIAARRATANDYALMVNKLTYERLIYPEYRLPESYEEFNKKLILTLKYIKTPTSEILYDMVLDRKNFSIIEKKQEVFIYGILSKKVVLKQTGNKTKILLISVMDTMGKETRLHVNKEIFLSEKAKLYKGAKQVIICGFGYKKQNNSKILTISDFCIKSVSDMGLITGI